MFVYFLFRHKVGNLSKGWTRRKVVAATNEWVMMKKEGQFLGQLIFCLSRNPCATVVKVVERLVC